MNRIEEMIEEGINCLIPIYQPDKGNSTKIIVEDGSVYMDNRTLKTVLKILCQYYTIQVEYCRKKYGKMIHQRISVPILINHKLLLVPFKMRKPMFEKDGAQGYINLYSIKETIPQEENTIIVLNNGQEVLCIQRIKTVQQNMNRARVIAGSSAAYLPSLDRPGEVKDFFEQYNSPATRGDIASLQKEMLELTRILRGIIERKS